jgi:hypothetical protein
MRVAISGTHCTGKSTLIEQFLPAHPDFAYEPEPFEALGDAFAAEPGAEEFYQQLEYNTGVLHQYGPGERVIFERSPADFLAYMFALAKLGRDKSAARLVESSMAMAQEAIPFLDLVVFLPADDWDGDAADSEDPELRTAVDTILEEILVDDKLGWFASSRPLVLRISGTTKQRLEMLEGVLQSAMSF